MYAGSSVALQTLKHIQAFSHPSYSFWKDVFSHI